MVQSTHFLCCIAGNYIIIASWIGKHLGPKLKSVIVSIFLLINYPYFRVLCLPIIKEDSTISIDSRNFNSWF